MKRNSKGIKEWGLRQYISIISAFMIALNSVLPTIPVFAEEDSPSSDGGVEASASESASDNSDSGDSSDSDSYEASDSYEEVASYDEGDSNDDGQTPESEDNQADSEENAENSDGNQVSESEENVSEGSEEKENSTDQSLQNGEILDENVSEGEEISSFAKEGDHEVVEDFANDDEKILSPSDSSFEKEQSEGDTQEGQEETQNTPDIQKIISDLNLSKEKKSSIVAKKLGIDWNKENGDYAILAGITEEYRGTLEQNEKIRNYLIANAAEIYKEKHGWNEWDTLPLTENEVKEEVKLNAEPITGEATYNGVTVNVTAPAESFPEGTRLVIKSLGDEESMTTLDIGMKELQLAEQVEEVNYDTPMVSFDISFYAADDFEMSKELQPAEGKTVEVTFDYAENEKFKEAEEDITQELKVFHIDDKDEAGNIVEKLKIEEVEIVKNEEGSIAVDAENFSTYVVTIIRNSAQIKDFESLVEAIEAAQDEDTLKLVANISLDGTLIIDKSINLDLNGHTITGPSGQKAVLLKKGNLVISNGTINSDDQTINVCSTGANVDNYASLTISSNTTIKGEYAVILREPSYYLCGGIGKNGNGVNIDIEGILYGNLWAIGNIESGNSTFNMNGTIISDDNGIANQGAVKTTVGENAKIIAYKSAIEVRAGEVVINGGIFESTGNPLTVTSNGNGTTTVGAAVAISQHKTNLPIHVTINGGTFSGVNSLLITNPEKNDIFSDDHKVEVEVVDGIFKGDVKSENQKEDSASIKNFIKGGNFSGPVSGEYLVEGYTLSEEGEVVYNPVAEVMVGGNLIGGYSSIRSAFAAVKNIEEQSDEISVVLKRNADFNKLSWGDNLVVNKKLTLDLSGYTLDVNCDHGNIDNGCIQVEDNLTIKNGKIEDKTPEDDFTYAIYLEENAVLNLKDIQLRGSRNDFKNALIKVNNGTLNINSSSFISSKNFCIEALSGSIVTINGESSFTSNITNETWNNAINMHTPYTKAIITGGKIDIFSSKGNKLFNDNDTSIFEVKGGTFNMDPTPYVYTGYYVVAKDGSYIVTNNTETAGNYVADPQTTVSGSGITNGSTLRNLAVKVEEHNDTIENSGAITEKFGSNATSLGEVKLTYKSGDTTINNVKFNKTILVKIPVNAEVSKVFVLAKHGDGDLGTGGLASMSSDCNIETGEPISNAYTGGLVNVVDGYASIYTCQASYFLTSTLGYKAILQPNGANNVGTQTVYYNYGTYNYYADEEKTQILEGGKIVIPTKNGYAFMGYFSGENQAIAEDGTILAGFNVASDSTYTAKWDNKQYNFSIEDIPASGTLSNGSTIAGKYNYNYEILLKAPTITDLDYEFNGWNLYSGSVDESNDKTDSLKLSCNENKAVCTFNMPNYDVVAKAKIEKREYTITFDSNGGTAVAAQTGIAYGHTGTVPENPIYTGFGFIGWTLNGQNFDITTTPITGNTTLKADWKANNENIFYTKGGTGFTIVLYEEDGKIDYTTTKAKNGLSTNNQLAAFLFGTEAATLTPTKIIDLFNTTKAEIVNIPDLGGAVLFLNYASGSTYPTKGFCSNSGCNYFASSSWTITGTLPSMDTGSALGPTRMDGAINYGKYMEIEGSGYVVLASTGNVGGYIYVPYKEFTVDYSYQGAPYWAEGLPTSGTYKYKDIVDVASLPTAQGYTFTGWFLDGEVTGPFKMPAKDVKLTGEFLNDDSNYRYHYELEKLDGNWETTGGNYGLNGSEGTKFNLPEPLQTFIGFSLTGDYSNLVIRSGFNFPIKFARNKYYLGYSYKNINGAETKKGYNIKFDADVTVLEEPTLTGYTFKWNGGYTGGKTFKMPAKTLTITGEFIPNTDTAYTVEHYQEKLDGTYELKDTDYKTGTTDTDIEVVLKNYEGFTGGIYSGAKIGADGKTVVEVKYARNIHSITFNSNSGSAVEPQEHIKYNGTGTEPAEPARTGYNFTGWYKDGSESKFDFNTPITENIILVAKWEPKTVEYSFVTRVENINDSNYTKIGTENRTGDIASEIKIQSELSGMVFVGFRVNRVRTDCEEGEDVCYYKIPDNSTGGTIDVHYKRNPIEITFDNNEGTGDVSSITAKYGSGITLPTPTRTGYNFKGWGENNLSGTYTVLENTGFTAQWEPATGTKYTVEYYLQNLSGTDYDLTGAATEILSGTTNDTGYALVKPFTGFTLNETSSQQTGTITASGDLVLKLYYDRNIYDVNYEFSGNVPEGALAPAKSGYKFGETVSVESGVLVSGYNFDGWYKDGELTGAFIMPATGVTLTGSFAPRRVNYQFHYEIEDLSGNFIPNGNVYARTGRAGSLNENPKEEPLLNYIRKSYPGFSLSGTIDDYRETIKGDGSTDIAIKLKRNEHEVKYVYENADNLSSTPSELPVSGTYKYDTPVTIAPLATASGYTFVWSGYEENDVFNMPNEDVVITGVFTPDETTYNVEYYYQGNDGLYVMSGNAEVRTGITDTLAEVTDEDKISLDSDHYAFDDANVNNVLSGTIRGDGELTLKVYFKGQYSVTYKPGDHGAFSEVTTSGLDYGATTPGRQNLLSYHEQGFIFDKWSPEWTGTVTGDIVYVAQWVPVEADYLVEHYQENLEGGYDLVATDPFTGDTKTPVEAIPNTYTGFTFSGDVEGSILSGEIKGDGSLTLKLYYTRNSHTFTYTNPDGNPVVKAVKYGEDISSETEDYEGYIFSGYMTEVPALMPDEDLIVTPIWDLELYKVTFNANGGDDVEDLFYTIESGIDTLPTPVWTGYEFTGWYDDNNNKVTSIATGSTGDVSLTAQWDAKVVEYTVKHYREAWEGYKKNNKVATQASDGKWYYEDSKQSFTGLINDNIGPVDPKTYNGFKFEPSVPNNITSGTLTDSGLELKLYYTRNTYTISFDTDGGNDIDEVSVGYYLTGEKPADPTKTGYTFAGWTLSGAEFNFDTYRVKNDIELKAGWTANEYTVEFDTAGAGDIDSITTGYDIEFALPTGDNLLNTGHNFIGWSKTSGGGTDYLGAQVVSGLVETGTIKLYPVWSVNTYTVNYDNGGRGTLNETSIGVDYGGSIPTPTFETVTGWTFSGWTLSGGDTVPDTMPDHDIDLVAEWTVNTHTVTYSYEGTVPAGAPAVTGSEIVEFGTGITLKDKPELSGYTFSGWTLSGATLDDTATSFTMPDNDVKLIGSWEVNSYTVTFDANGGADVEAMTGDYNSEITLPTANRTGYTFSGWIDENNNKYDAGSRYTISGDATLTGKWDIETYEITYVMNSGDNVAGNPSSYDYEHDINLTDPTRTGYDFSGWTYRDITTPTTPISIASGTITGDIEFTANWNAQTYTVTFSGDGVDTSTTGVTYDGTYPELPAASRTGYTFSGWYDANNNLVQSGDKVSITGDTTLHPEWTLNNYTITFNLAGGTGVDNTGYTVETPDFTLPEPTKTGYTFTGWTGDNGATPQTTVTIVQGTTTGDKSYTANWNVNQYHIAFIDYDGTVLSGADYDYETASGNIVLPADPIRTGYTFTGWTGIPDTMPANDVTGTATYEINSYTLKFVVDGADYQTGTLNYGSGITAPADPKRDCNNFAGWTSSVEGLTTTGTMPDSDVTFTANWNYTCSRSFGGGGGGGGSSSKQEVVLGGEVQISTGDTEDGTGTKYTQEMIDSYEWAHEKGITSKNTIEEAKLKEEITRGELAKMMVMFMSGVLHKQPVITGTINYEDVTGAALGDLPEYIQLAYQYQIMGIHADGTPLKKFNPKVKVSRAEFATVLSRVLFGDKYNQSGAKYYEKHIEALAAAKILSNKDPRINELRGWVILMLCRSQNIEPDDNLLKGVDGTDVSVSTGDARESNTETGSTQQLIEKIVLGLNNITQTKTETGDYTQEMIESYEWSHANGITSAKNIKEAKMYTPITRAELAKMMVMYMSGTLHKQQVITGNTNYEDVSEESLGDLAEYIQLAYQYQIMGIKADGTPTKKFNPKAKVTRGEFATVLSRVLFGSVYNQGGVNYYEKHIKALSDSKILTKLDPTIKELRGQVMLMLYRSRNMETKENS